MNREDYLRLLFWLNLGFVLGCLAMAALVLGLGLF